jgi:hypothetical protein
MLMVICCSEHVYVKPGICFLTVKYQKTMNFPPKSHLFLTITIQLQDDTTIAAPVFE